MTEFEIKLEVPRTRAKAVGAALARLKPRLEQLRAIYYDVPERLLQREKLALRLRCEGRRWVQTLKGEGSQPLERLEHNVAVARVRDTPKPVAARHLGTDVGGKLIRVLGEGFEDSVWEPVFEADVERLTATLEEDGSRVEIAFDRGHVVAGGRKAPLCEIEFELKEGDPRAAVEVARRWCAQHGLWLSTIGKAQKGFRLARGEGVGPPVGARASRFDANASLRRIAGEALMASLEHVIANASEIAAGARDEEHVHQMRVGIRRARTALRELVRKAPGVEEEALVHAFRELGKHRDIHHVLEAIAPRLRDSGGPAPGEHEEHVPAPSGIVRARAFQDAVLSLLGLAGALRQDEGSARGARREIARRLSKLHKAALRDGVRFDKLDATRQHRVRKRLKRLRYLIEFTAPLHGHRKRDAYIDALKKVQDALGDYNDEMTALDHFRARVDMDPDAWFAVGWLEADRQHSARECVKLLRRLAKTNPFWC